jgi:O-antigen ligase
MARVLFYPGLFFVSILVFRLDAFTVGDLLLIASAVALVLAIKKPVVKNPLPISTALATVLLVVGGALSSAVSPNPSDSVQVLVRLLFVVVVLPWQCRLLLTTDRRLTAAAVWFGAGAAVCGAGTVLQYAFGPLIIPGTEVTNAGRFPGFAGHVSDTGGITALAVIIGLILLARPGRRRAHLLAALILVGGLVGVILSGSVSGFLAIAVAVIYIVLRRGIAFRRLFFAGVLTAVGFYIANTVLAANSVALTPLQRIEATLGISSTVADVNTASSRLETDRLGWEGFLAHPLTGVGLDGPSALVMGNLGVHNFWIAALYQGGIFIALGLAVVVIGIMASGLRHTPRSTVPLAIYASVLAMLAFAMTAPSFFNRYFWVPLALLSASMVLSKSRHLHASASTAQRNAVSGS